MPEPPLLMRSFFLFLRRLVALALSLLSSARSLSLALSLPRRPLPRHGNAHAVLLDDVFEYQVHEDVEAGERSHGRAAHAARVRTLILDFESYARLSSARGPAWPLLPPVDASAIASRAGTRLWRRREEAAATAAAAVVRGGAGRGAGGGLFLSASASANAPSTPAGSSLRQAVTLSRTGARGSGGRSPGAESASAALKAGEKKSR